jgi:hypothetical protein
MWPKRHGLPRLVAGASRDHEHTVPCSARSQRRVAAEPTTQHAQTCTAHASAAESGASHPHRQPAFTPSLHCICLPRERGRPEQRAPPTDPASRLELIIDTLHALMHPCMAAAAATLPPCMCYLLVFFRDCPPARLIMAWTTPRTVQFRRLLDASVMSHPFDFDQHPCITVWDPYICMHVY